MCGKRFFIFILNFSITIQDYDNGGTVTNLRCTNSEILTDRVKYRNRRNETVTTIRIIGCAPPDNYKRILDLLKVDTSGIKELQLFDAPENLKGHQLEGLTMEKLRINSKRNGDHMMSMDFLANLTTVKYLALKGTVLHPLPVTNITNLKLEHGSSTGSFGDCSSLKHLVLKSWDFTLIPNRWLSNCSLETLEVQHQLEEDQLGRLLRDGVGQLKRLAIRGCNIARIDTELKGADNLEHLDLTYNQLRILLPYTILPSLTSLDISYNNIVGSAFVAAVLSGQLQLRNFTMNNNPYLDLCDIAGYRISAPEFGITDHTVVPLVDIVVHQPELEYLSLEGCGSVSLCLSDVQLNSLSYLNVGHNRINTLEILDLPSTNRSYTVNVSGNPIFSFPFQEPQYYKLKHPVTLVGLEPRTIECVCSEHTWLAAALRERRLVTAAVTCQDGRRLEQVPQHEWECDKITCAGNCDCQRKLDSNETMAVCLDDLTRLPPGLVDALMGLEPGVNITVLNLSNNHIARLNTSEVEALFSDRHRKVYLAGNPILCDCENDELLQALEYHQEQILDYTQLGCAGGDPPLMSLCVEPRVWLTATMATTGAIVGIGALLTAMCCMYKKEIKIYLYARGFCLCCVTEDELDFERQYDAFVSFSHLDDEFVMEEFVPKIDEDYKICTHYRDWVAGEMIPNQIAKSVENSRRTIIILSKNFLESIWGLLEFKTAHTSSLVEGRVRLIIVVIDDVIDDLKSLDDELRIYLRTHTYIKWGDPWFWKKLLYAMPHQPLKENVTESRVELQEMRTRPYHQAIEYQEESIPI